MTIQTLCDRCGVTKKAVAYAIEQGLLTPAVQENGYRIFTEEDACTMERISTLRWLGLSTSDIRVALSASDWTTICRAQAQQLADMQEKHRILLSLAESGNWSSARQSIRKLTLAQPLTERLRRTFPGPFGAFLAAHFAPYLTEPIQTAVQQSAWNEAIAWLDSAEFACPDDLAEWYKCYAAPPSDIVDVLKDHMEAALRDQTAYLAEHAEEIRRYQEIKASDEYQQSPPGRLERLLQDFMSQSGYTSVFISAMRRLSPSYDAYQLRLQAANVAFVAAFDKNTKETP